MTMDKDRIPVAAFRGEIAATRESFALAEKRFSGIAPGHISKVGTLYVQQLGTVIRGLLSSADEHVDLHEKNQKRIADLEDEVRRLKASHAVLDGALQPKDGPASAFKVIGIIRATYDSARLDAGVTSIAADWDDVVEPRVTRDLAKIRAAAARELESPTVVFGRFGQHAKGSADAE